MSGPSRQVKMSAVRMFVLTLLVLGMVLQPVMAAVGEYHEFEHNVAGTPALALHSDQASRYIYQQRGATVDQPPADDAPALHVLLHFAHCCGGTAAVLVGGPALIAALGSVTIAAVNPQAPRPVLLPAPFKPPINM